MAFTCDDSFVLKGEVLFKKILSCNDGSLGLCIDTYMVLGHTSVITAVIFGDDRVTLNDIVVGLDHRVLILHIILGRSW